MAENSLLAASKWFIPFADLDTDQQRLVTVNYLVVTTLLDGLWGCWFGKDNYSCKCFGDG